MITKEIRFPTTPNSATSMYDMLIAYCFVLIGSDVNVFITVALPVSFISASNNGDVLRL